MPNWIHNFIRITGPVEKMKDLWNKSLSGHHMLSVMCLVPGDIQPEHLDSWFIENWSTKRDLEDPELSLIYVGKGESIIVGRFLSAWSPPVNCFKTFADRNPDYDIDLSFYCDGNLIGGTWDAKTGLCQINDIHYKIRDPSPEHQELLNRLICDFPSIPKNCLMMELQPKNRTSFQDKLSDFVYAFDNGDYKMGLECIDKLMN